MKKSDGRRKGLRMQDRRRWIWMRRRRKGRVRGRRMRKGRKNREGASKEGGRRM